MRGSQSQRVDEIAQFLRYFMDIFGKAQRFDVIVSCFMKEHLRGLKDIVDSVPH